MADVVNRAKEAAGSAKATYRRFRRSSGLFDLLLRVQERYTRMDGRQQAAAITYYGFLSFFPILALAIAAVGLVDRIWPKAQDALTKAINQVIPGMIGPGDGQISIDQMHQLSGWAGLIGLIGIVWAGTYWVTSLRSALYLVFDVSPAERPSYAMSKLADVLALAVIGSMLLVSVAGAGLVTAFSTEIYDWIGLSTPLVLDLVAHLASWLVSVVLFYAILRMVPHAQVQQRSRWEAAALGALGFEAMKALSFLILGSVEGSLAFQAFGISIVVLIWLNYFSRVIFYAGCYACEIRPTGHHTTAMSAEPAPEHHLTHDLPLPPRSPE